MARLLAAILFSAIFVSVQSAKRTPEIIFTDDAGGECKISMKGNVLSSPDCEIHANKASSSSGDLGERIGALEFMAADMTGDISSVTTKLDGLETTVKSMDSGIHAILCKPMVETNQLLSVKGSRTHGDGYCRYDCSTGHHDADNNGDCTACLTSCDTAYKLTGSCTTDSSTSCEKDPAWCPASLPSFERGSATVDSRTIGHKITVACEEASRYMSFECKLDRTWQVDGSCSSVPVFSGAPETLSGYQMALNINTGDGNFVDWDNTDFWEGHGSYGSCGGDDNQGWTCDYKNQAAWNLKAKNYLAVVHINGIIQGWRAFTANHPDKSLRELLSDSNTFRTGATCKHKITNGIIAEGFPGTVHKNKDPIIKEAASDLYAGCNTGCYDCSACEDRNRISAKSSIHQCQDNGGWGLGTKYDAGLGHRPECDAMYHQGNTWNPGIIGTDCGNRHHCYWCHNSGDHFDYAIFVK
jgi:hypothetical protein